MKTEFTAEDFGQFDHENVLTTTGDALSIANALLPEIKKAWLDELLASEIGKALKKELLKDAPVFFGMSTDEGWLYSEWKDGEETHKAFLVDIKEIEK